MIVLKNFEKLPCKTVITIGNFDGVHIAHRLLIEKTKSVAKQMNAKSLVFSFCPHTKQILSDPDFKTIYTTDEKRFLLSKLNIDYLMELPFNLDIANLNSVQFLNLLTQNLNCIGIVTGSDFKIGNDNFYPTFRNLKNNLVIENVSNINFGRKKISSTYIRKLLVQKDLDQIEKMLGQKYFVMDKVIHGLKRNISLPTINFIPDKNKLLPPDGVYFTTVCINNIYYKGVTNIGFNPTVNNNFRCIETHILDFKQNIYGQSVFVYFNKFIRPEIKFDSVAKLKMQIQKDVDYVISI